MLRWYEKSFLTGRHVGLITSRHANGCRPNNECRSSHRLCVLGVVSSAPGETQRRRVDPQQQQTSLLEHPANFRSGAMSTPCVTRARRSQRQKCQCRSRVWRQQFPLDRQQS